MRAQTTSPSLLTRAGNGDAAAWHELDARYGTLILRFCLRLGLQRTDAEDIRQAVMVRLFKALPSFEYQPGRGRFRSYIWRFVRNEISRQRSRPVLARERVDGGDPEWSRGTALEAEWEQEWVQHHLRVALRRVRETHDPRSVRLFERLLEGRSIEEVATEFRMSVPAVHKVKQRIRRRMKRIVAQQIRIEDSDGSTG